MTTETSAPARHQTGIQWTHVPGYQGATWNPTTGCTRVSPGCDHCYAFALHDQRYKVNRDHARAHSSEMSPAEYRALSALNATDFPPPPCPPQYDRPFSQVQLLDEHRLREPLRAKKPRAYFVDSMADLFHEDVPDAFLDRVFAVIARSPQHIFMVLTKRPERMRAYVSDPATPGRVMRATSEDGGDSFPVPIGSWVWPLRQVWLGVSVEDQARADERIPLLMQTPAAIRFLSCEPLLEAIEPALFDLTCAGRGPSCSPYDAESPCACGSEPTIDWVIVGGESGQGARPFDLGWARSLREQCEAAGVALFVKQLGAKPHGAGATDSDFAISYRRAEEPGAFRILRSAHGSVIGEWPEDLQRRQFPAGLGEWSAR